MSARECPSSRDLRKAGPKAGPPDSQRPSSRPGGPSARQVLSAPGVQSLQPLNQEAERSDAAGVGRVRGGGCRFSAPPTRDAQSCTDPRPPQPAWGTRSPRSPVPLTRAMQTRREAGGRELPSKAQERRLQGYAGLGGCRPAALRPPPLAPAGCCCSRGACRIGPPKPKAGGKNRRKVARVRLGAGTIPPPTRRASCGKSEAPASRCAALRARSGSRETAPSTSGAAGKLLLLGCWRQTRGDHGRPQVHGGRCNAEGD